MVGALSALVHNGNLIDKAEKILKDAVKNEHTYIWIELPDGNIIKLNDGFKINHVEIVPFVIEK